MRTRLSNVLCAPLLAIAIVAGATSPVRGDVQLSVDVGWGNHFLRRTMESAVCHRKQFRRREVVLEVYSPTDQRYAMKVRQSFAAGPTPRTLPIYIPLISSLDQTSVTLLDADTGRTLDSFKIEDPDAPLRQRSEMVNLGQLMIGTSGNEGTERLLDASCAEAMSSSATWRWPIFRRSISATMRWTCLSLTAPNVNRLDADQQLRHRAMDSRRRDSCILAWRRSASRKRAIDGSLALQTRRDAHIRHSPDNFEIARTSRTLRHAHRAGGFCCGG